MKQLILTGLAAVLAFGTKAQQDPLKGQMACSPQTIRAYKPGMLFYYPPTASLVQRNPVYTEYAKTAYCPGDTVKLRQVSYQDLSGKTLKLEKTDSFQLGSYPGGNHWKFTYTLTNIACPETFTCTVIMDRRTPVVIDSGQAPAGGYTIRGGIYLKEVEEADKALKGQFYSLFPTRNGRYEPVTITKVEPGTWETPLRIHFSYAGVADTTIDVNGCGTNVLNSYKTAFHFSTYFVDKSPQDTIGKERWKLIRNGKIAKSMTTAQVKMALGKPAKIKVPIEGGENSEEWFYADYHLYFKDDKLIKIE
ncbi:MAG TPA: hypothetical protein VHK91_14380 [Flavisolibacter sp.]|jgi:hypothetical protein|nr:hypothetical protein [Flavisolibacter sp.]